MSNKEKDIKEAAETTPVNAKTGDMPAESKAKKVLKFILNTIINILIVFVLIISLLIAIMSITSKNSGISNIFGFTMQSVQTNSMKGGSPDGYKGGDYSKGDLIIGRFTDYNETAEYQVGDIVTQRVLNDDGVYVLLAHRIINRVKGSDGYYRYQTQGDNRDTDDPDAALVPDQQNEDNFIAAYDIASELYSDKYQGVVIKGLGGWLDDLKTKPGNFLLYIILPMSAFFLYALVRVVISSKNYRKAKEKEMKEDAEKEKQEAVAAALAEKNSKEDAKPADASADMTPEQMEQFKQFLAFQKAQQATEAAEAPAEDAAPDEATAENPAEED